MTSRTHSRWLTVGLFAIAIFAVAATVAIAAPNTAPSQQGSSCTWPSIGNANKAVYDAASAMDTVNNHMYLYGGLDQTQATLNTVQRIDLSGASIDPAPHSLVSGVGSLKRFGAAGAFRAKGDDSAVYFFGGSGDAADGAGTDDVQVYNVKTKAWTKTSPGGTFEDRLLHAAAYDPVHDVIWVTGGIAKCSLDDIANGSCTARTLATRYLKFDPTSGDPSWSQLSGAGPNQVYAHTMVYDPLGKRMLVIGGTRDGRLGSNTVWSLDLSKGLVGASWSQVTTAGTVLPRLAAHVSAFDAMQNRVVVYGGVTSNYGLTGENASDATYALDLAQNPPVWANLNASVQERVGSAMEYSPLHKVVVIAVGRRKAQSTQQNVQRSSHVLECADQPTQVPSPPTTAPTSTGVPTGLPSPPTVAPTPTTMPTPAESVQVCSFIQRFSRVPPAVIASAVANPTKVYGFYLLCNPNVESNIVNRPRRYLSIHDTARPWHPLYNSLELKCGCP